LSDWGVLVLGAAIVSAVAAAVTALGGLIVSVFVLVPSLRVQKVIHKIVNQQRTDMQNYQRVLVATLQAHGISIPHDQSAPQLPPTTEQAIPDE
jgi:uncharacterized membrane protein